MYVSMCVNIKCQHVCQHVCQYVRFRRTHICSALSFIITEKHPQLSLRQFKVWEYLTLGSHCMPAFTIITSVVTERQSGADMPWQRSNHKQAITDLRCRLRTGILLLGDAGIHTKVSGACDQYLVPSCDFDEYKDFCVRIACLLLAGTPQQV